MESKSKNQQASNSAGNLIKKGNELRRLGKLDEAIAYYKEASQIAPDIFIVHQQLGEILAEQKRFEVAIKEYKEAIVIKSNSVQTHYQLGHLFFQQGNLEEAKKWIKNGIKLTETKYVGKFYYKLGEILFREGKQKAAIAAWKRCLDNLETNNTFKIYKNIGDAKCYLGEIEAALENYQIAFQIQPQKFDLSRQNALFILERIVCRYNLNKEEKKEILNSISHTLDALQPSTFRLIIQNLENQIIKIFSSNNSKNKFLQEETFVISDSEKNSYGFFSSVQANTKYVLTGYIAAEKNIYKGMKIQIDFMDWCQQKVSITNQYISTKNETLSKFEIGKNFSKFELIFETPNEAQYIRIHFQKNGKFKARIFIKNSYDLICYQKTLENNQKLNVFFSQFLEKNFISKIIYIHIANDLIKQDRLFLANQLYIQLGKISQQEGNLEEAIDFYDHAIQIDPNSFEAYQEMGNLFIKQEKWCHAIQYYCNAINVCLKQNQLEHKQWIYLYERTIFAHLECEVKLLFQKNLDLLPQISLFSNLLKDMYLEKTYSVPYKGNTINFFLPNPEDHIQNIIFKNNTFYELSMLINQFKTLKTKKNSVVLDIGANLGNHSLFLAKFCDANVYALEPNLYLYLLLSLNILYNQLSTRIKPFKMAVGKVQGRGSSLILNHCNLGQSQFKENQNGNVQLTTIDHFCKINCLEKVDLIKIDVEGMEMEVLSGGYNTIKKDKPSVYIEAQNQKAYKRIADYLEHLNYKAINCFNATPTYQFEFQY